MTVNIYKYKYIYMYILTWNSFSLADLAIVIFLDYSTVKYHCYKTGNKYVHITYRISAEFISESTMPYHVISDLQPVRS